MNRELTASVYIIHNEKVLLIFHRKLKKWVQPGGHVDANEAPTEAALREAREETGLEVELLSNDNVQIDCWNAKSVARPYLCLIEEIPEYNGTPAHQHIDFLYLARPVGGREILNAAETDGMKWFTLEEIESLPPDREIFAETQQVLRSILCREQLHYGIADVRKKLWQLYRSLLKIWF